MAGNSGNPIDTDLIASNVRDGVDIFGVTGDYSGEGVQSGGAFGDNRYYPATELWGRRTSAIPSFFPKGIYDAGGGVYYYACSTVFSLSIGQDDLRAIFHIIKDDNGTYSIYTSEHFTVQGSPGAKTAFITEDSGNIYLTLSATSGTDIGHIYFDTSTDTFVDGGNSSLVVNLGICGILGAITTLNNEDYTRVDEITGTGLGSALPTTVVIGGDTFGLDYFVTDSFGSSSSNPIYRQRWITKT